MRLFPHVCITIRFIICKLARNSREMILKFILFLKFACGSDCP